MSSRQIDRFGCLTFHREIMKKVLPKDVFINVTVAMEGKGKINALHADVIANALKDWAISLGATHFCHWFQPLTGAGAEKHDAFLDIGPGCQVIEKFSGKLLFRGEPDASSFPSGGLRKTAEARGYTCWDVESPPFIWKSGSTSTLCIPAIFFSWCGKALDMKIPLIRSEEKLNQAACRLLRLLEVDVSKVFSTLGPEQEYFLMARDYFDLRPDLKITGRTVFGAPSPKAQEFEDHYFSSVPEQVLYFMQEVESRAIELGIPLRTRHSEVAPHQYEMAPLFEKSSQAVNHNLLLMQLMHQVAEKHELACLFHEKPFAGINGSGKHCNWSFSTDSGMNLLDPALLEKQPFLFLTCITAVLSAVCKHPTLLRASIASAGNDHRLGGNEAPPALLSAYLGEELEKFLQAIERQCETSYLAESSMDLNVPSLPPLFLDTMDRNRTAPFAFTGNKFEFRSVGASAHPAGPVTVLNAIVAESLLSIGDQIESLKGKKSLKHAVLEVIQKELEFSRKIRYLGDNYHSDWKEEAAQRGFVSIEKSVNSLYAFLQEEVDPLFEGILSKEERMARVNIAEHQYINVISAEAKIMLEIFYTQVLPVCLKYQTALAKNIHWLDKTVEGFSVRSKEFFLEVSVKIQAVLEAANALKVEVDAALSISSSHKTFAFSSRVVLQMSVLRKGVDALEMLVQADEWPLPKYREMFFFL